MRRVAAKMTHGSAGICITLNTRGDLGEAADTSLLPLPTVSKMQEGKPTEAVTDHPRRNGEHGLGHRKDHSAPQRRQQIRRGSRPLNARLPTPKLAEAAPIVPHVTKANITYKVMNTVPETGFPSCPFVWMTSLRPAPDSSPMCRHAPHYRRRYVEMPQYQRVRPCTILLREGREKLNPKAYYIHEEQVPRAGVQVSQSFQRTRWNFGKVFTWLGVQKQTDRGEGSTNSTSTKLSTCPCPAPEIEKSMGVRGSSIQRVTSHKASSRPALLKN